MRHPVGNASEQECPGLPVATASHHNEIETLLYRGERFPMTFV
jgi:hypothetical protein